MPPPATRIRRIERIISSGCYPFVLIRTLLAQLIDYAGLFPPAALNMQAAVSNFAAYRTGPYAYALGRFIVPAARLEELADALPGDVEYPWNVSALASANLEADLAAIDAFQTAHRDRASIDTIELRADTPGQVESAARRIPEDLTAYFEIPVRDDPAELVSAIAATGQRAKIRTGGVTPDAFPEAADIVRFLSRCAEHNAAFKATAGLHHPLRCRRPLTYSPGAPQGWMNGFLNVFLAAAWIRLGIDPKAIVPLLAVEDRAEFELTRSSLSWHVYRITAADLEHIRHNFAIAFGSCSFEEPLEDLRALGWLAAPAAVAGDLA